MAAAAVGVRAAAVANQAVAARAAGNKPPSAAKYGAANAKTKSALSMYSKRQNEKRFGVCYT